MPSKSTSTLVWLASLCTALPSEAVVDETAFGSLKLYWSEPTPPHNFLVTFSSCLITKNDCLLDIYHTGLNTRTTYNFSLLMSFFSRRLRLWVTSENESSSRDCRVVSRGTILLTSIVSTEPLYSIMVFESFLFDLDIFFFNIGWVCNDANVSYFYSFDNEFLAFITCRVWIIWSGKFID